MKIRKDKELNRWYDSNCSYEELRELKKKITIMMPRWYDSNCSYEELRELKKKYNDYDDTKVDLSKYYPVLDRPSKWEELERYIEELDDMKAKLKQERDLRKKAEKEVEAFRKAEEARKAEAEAKALEKDPDDDGMLGSGIFVAKPV